MEISNGNMEISKIHFGLIALLGLASFGVTASNSKALTEEKNIFADDSTFFLKVNAATVIEAVSLLVIAFTYYKSTSR